VRVTGVSKTYARRSLDDRLRRRPGAVTVALDDVSLTVNPRESIGIVGESGSGKTTLARTLVQLVMPDTGRVEVAGVDVAAARGRALAALRRRIQLVYQDPYSSLNPALTVAQAIAEPAVVHGLVAKQHARQRVEELMGQVGLGHGLVDRRPRELSGGQRQRVAIARALAAEPTILVADEAVSALDVSIQAQVLRLFAQLQDELGLTLIFVSHQLATVAQLCERVAIMYRGRIVEIGPTADVFSRPGHGYTDALLRAHPSLERDSAPLSHQAAPASPPPPSGAPGCPFQHRCRYVADPCLTVDPGPEPLSAAHTAWCHVLPQERR
jgi:oligopeptide transport system ATP-binding protein